MNAVHKIQHPWGLRPQPENIPVEMRGGKWCVWRAAHKDESRPDKVDKIPYRPIKGRRKTADSSNPETFGSFDEAVATLKADAKYFDGIGRLVGKGEVWTDLDKCLVDGGLQSDLARQIVNDFGSYTEVSPSGTGLRIFGFGVLPGTEATDHKNHVELYGEQDERFLTITGHVFEGRSKICALPQGAVEDVYRRFKRVKAAVTGRPQPEILTRESLPDLGISGLDLKHHERLESGFFGDDRSADLQLTTKALFSTGLYTAQQVFSILYHSRALDMALDKRRQNHDKAVDYLWRQHVLPAEHCAPWIGFDEGKADTKPKQKPKKPIDLFLARYVHIAKGDLVCDLLKESDTDTVTLTEFRSSTANVRHDVPDPTNAEPERTKQAPVHQSWLVHPNRKSAHSLVYRPDVPKRMFVDDMSVARLNSFRLPKHKKGWSANQLAVFFDHLDYILPIDSERRWFLDWLAFIVQRPQQRCKVTPLHVAQLHGTGRGFLVEVIQKLLGAWNCTKTKMDVLCGEGSGGGFQEYLHNSLVCFIEEAKEGGRRWAVSDKIRGTLTENTLPVNRKHIGATTQEVYTNFFMMTNHRDALVLTNEDRRIQVLSGPSFLQDSDYYDRLYGWLQTDGPAALYRYLEDRDIHEFDWRRSSETPGRRWMIESNRSPTEELFWAVMEDLPAPGLTKSQFQNAMLKASSEDAFETEINDRELVKLLQEHSAGKIKLKVSKGQVFQVWVLDATKSKLTAEDKAALREGVLAYGA